MKALILNEQKFESFINMLRTHCSLAIRTKEDKNFYIKCIRTDIEQYIKDINMELFDAIDEKIKDHCVSDH